MESHLIFKEYQKHLIQVITSFIRPRNPMLYSHSELKEELDINILSLKNFLHAYYNGSGYFKGINYIEKVNFWEQFQLDILEKESRDRPTNMKEKTFLFDVKFKEYSEYARKEIVDECKHVLMA